MAPLFSFIIPTYNRAALVVRAVDSALAWIGSASDVEIVIVDDCSSDGTLESLRERFSTQLHSGMVRLILLSCNGGVTKAKNAGVTSARGEWLIFLDSDDEMVVESPQAMRHSCRQFADAPLLFFRCIKMGGGELLGPPQTGPRPLSLRAYLNSPALGECLPVLRREAATRFPYDENLRGWEGLAYARILRHMGEVVILPIMARRYRAEGDDRLSSQMNMRRRRRNLAKGHCLLVKEFAAFLTARQLSSALLKATLYFLASMV